MEIRVLELRLLPGNRTTQAFADIKLDTVVIRDFRIVQNGGKPYVKAPFTTYRNQTGELCFRQIIELPDEVRGQIDTAILSEYYREKEQAHDRPNGQVGR